MHLTKKLHNMNLKDELLYLVKSTVETRYKEIWDNTTWYNKLISLVPINFLCFVLYIDYWYNKISDTVEPRYKEVGYNKTLPKQQCITR